jgi:hypothetical protein
MPGSNRRGSTTFKTGRHGLSASICWRGIRQQTDDDLRTAMAHLNARVGHWEIVGEYTVLIAG